MRILAAAFLAVLALDASAQSAARPRPPGTVPLDEPAPPPPLVEKDPALEPQVTTRTDEQGQVVQEYRVNGRLYMQRVTPRHGVPYVLIDDRGDGTFTRQDNTLDRLRVPQWTLWEF
jgi:uncharacterized protein DUF2782